MSEPALTLKPAERHGIVKFESWVRWRVLQGEWPNMKEMLARLVDEAIGRAE